MSNRKFPIPTVNNGMGGLSVKPPEKVGKNSFYLASILFKIWGKL